MVTTRVGQLAHVTAHLSGGLLTPATPGGEVARGWVAGLNEVGGPHSKARFVLAGHPEHAADNRDRERVGELVDQADAVPPGEVVNQASDDLVQLGDQAIDPVGAVWRPEVSHEPSPCSVMLGRVERSDVGW